MAVQQNKKSPSKRGMHRSHNALTVPGIAVESTTGEIHLRHHISPTGFYRGRKVLKPNQKRNSALQVLARTYPAGFSFGPCFASLAVICATN